MVQKIVRWEAGGKTVQEQQELNEYRCRRFSGGEEQEMKEE